LLETHGIPGHREQSVADAEEAFERHHGERHAAVGVEHQVLDLPDVLPLSIPDRLPASQASAG
jgi:hypothetical protein